MTELVKIVIVHQPKKPSHSCILADSLIQKRMKCCIHHNSRLLTRDKSLLNLLHSLKTTKGPFLLFKWFERTVIWFEVFQYSFSKVESRTQGSRPSQGHKKIRGQGQPYREQTLPRPRTGMLKAKTKDTSVRAFQKKKVFRKFFQAISKKKQKRSIEKIFRRSQKKSLYQNFAGNLRKYSFPKKALS